MTEQTTAPVGAPRAPSAHRDLLRDALMDAQANAMNLAGLLYVLDTCDPCDSDPQMGEALHAARRLAVPLARDLSDELERIWDRML